LCGAGRELSSADTSVYDGSQASRQPGFGTLNLAAEFLVPSFELKPPGHGDCVRDDGSVGASIESGVRIIWMMRGAGFSCDAAFLYNPECSNPPARLRP